MVLCNNIGSYKNKINTMEVKEIPVLLLTGYLGSGKTTLLNRILNNERGIKFAVIVNDIGEVNIDADLIQKGGVVDQKDDSLVSLQNGCICCTLKMDLVQQLSDIAKMGKFDYIVIEASGICEPAPIAQTICSIPQMGAQYNEHGTPRLDCIVTVVDALRMKDEFGCGKSLLGAKRDEEDIENLVIQQIEFCNIILLNKASEVAPEELERVRQIVRAIQPKAEIIDCDYGDVDFEKILGTGRFDFDDVATSAAWIGEIENHTNDNDIEDEDHRHHHEYEHEHDEHDEHHHHDHDHDHDHHHEHHHHDHDDDCESHHGGECTCQTFFQSVTYNNGVLILVLIDGTTVRIQTEFEKDTRFDTVVPHDLQLKVEKYMPLYTGVNPPNVEGCYLIEPQVAVYHEDYGNGGYEPGHMFLPVIMRFSNQDTRNNTLDYAQSEGGQGANAHGNGAYISGNGSNFTAYFLTEGAENGIYTKTALVVSGTKTADGIKDLYYAYIMEDKGYDPVPLLMNIGAFRVNKDSDGMSVNTTWTGDSRAVQPWQTPSFMKRAE